MGVLLAIVLPTFCILGLRARVGASATGDGAAVSGLPPDATDVHWFLPGAFGPNTVYEFKTTEAGYQQWVQNRRDGDLEGPTRGAFRVLRYDDATADFAWRDLKNTIAYTWNEEDRGLYMVYDLDGGRAYYWWHSR